LEDNIAGMLASIPIRSRHAFPAMAVQHSTFPVFPQPSSSLGDVSDAAIRWTPRLDEVW